MARYRILEHDYGKHKNYEIQRKSIFGWWYNPDNIDSYTTGFFDTLKEALNPVKFIDQAEKNTQSVLAYVQPAELSKTLITLTSNTSDFARAQLAAFESITSIVKSQTEEFTKNFEKATSKISK